MHLFFVCHIRKSAKLGPTEPPQGLCPRTRLGFRSKTPYIAGYTPKNSSAYPNLSMLTDPCDVQFTLFNFVFFYRK